jgi:hypothetical protein
MQQGYALKQAGNCKDAIPHFLESIRLDKQAKGLVNLADCEQATGKYVAAQAHFVEARDLARQQSLGPIGKLAEERLQALEQRMPKLTIKLAGDAPSSSVVTKDGVELRAISLGIPLPVDPGAHVIEVHGGGFEKRYEVTLSEKENRQLDVSPAGGTRKESPPNAPAAAAPTPPGDSPAASTPAAAAAANPSADRGASMSATSSSSQRTIGFIVGGVGIVGLGVGTVFALQTSSKNSDAEGLCTASAPCHGDGLTQYQDAIDGARQARTLSAIGFAAGGIGLAAGAILILTAPSTSASSAATRPPGTSTGLQVWPAWGAGSYGAVAGGAW